jgi:sarcosine oxidase/L-pipecolate oxidase
MSSNSTKLFEEVTMISRDSRIVILGGGAWGLSTALYLVEAGYCDITILERAKTIPSPYSAAYDLNKIVRAEYEDEFYSRLALVCVSLHVKSSRFDY